jgi:hypothetical protein
VVAVEAHKAAAPQAQAAQGAVAMVQTTQPLAEQEQSTQVAVVAAAVFYLYQEQAETAVPV